MYFVENDESWLLYKESQFIQSIDINEPPVDRIRVGDQNIHRIIEDIILGQIDKVEVYSPVPFFVANGWYGSATR